MTGTPRLNLPEPQASDSMTISPPAFATTWTNVDAAVGPTFCTSTTKPASPYACQWIYQTDINQEQIWDPIASAWITIKHNPSGIATVNGTGAAAVNTTQANVSIAAISTEYQVSIINNIAIEPFRNYKVHVEGICGFTWTGNQALSQPTQMGEAFVRYTNTATVDLTGTQLGLHSVDAMQSGDGASLNVLAQQNFAFDDIYTGTSASVLSVLWSYKLTGSLLADYSNQYAQNSLIYVEQV